MDTSHVFAKIASLPTSSIKEVENFVDLLLTKSKSDKVKHRTPGLAKGLVRINEDFDEPLDDFEEYME